MACHYLPEVVQTKSSKVAVAHGAADRVAQHSDAETFEYSCSSGLPSPCSSGTSDVRKEEEEGPCSIVVRSTFIDVTDGRSLVRRYRRLRRLMTDSVLTGIFVETEAYEPGKFSEGVSAKAQDAPSHVIEQRRAPPATLGSEAKGRKAKEVMPQTAEQACGRTTVMLRNVPNNYTRDMLLTLLNEQGFSSRYDFVYLPIDFRRRANLGYAFVNLTDEASVDALWSTFDGFSGWALPTAKVCQVSWSGPHQGFKAHVERYRNSPVMHRSVPDEYKPVIFEHGLRKNFPRPTKKVKAPTGC
mmetsp:Transcript_23213/g.41076  ORF Transcript_23213/g.41076 Transcript_23213/m.41076 type:complete len:299 (+) Transcript_23213:59-955(+)